MPARKSCASRIMGDRAVRAMAVSTSFSTEASVPSTISMRIGSVTSDLHVAVLVHRGGEARVQGDGGAVLLDDGRAVDDGAGLQRGALEDRGVVRLLEDHAPGLLDGLDLLVRVTPDRRPGDGPDAGDAQVDPFDRVARVVPVGIPVELLVRLVEAAGDLLPPFVVERAGRGGHPDLERLPVVAQV